MNTREYSFWDLISKYRIEIPAIQRDYAQGRKSEIRIATSLVNDLFVSLTSSEAKKINLHFVYGKIENDHLIPLDGQQRLTTLFLLHWFLSIGKLSDFDKNTLSKFVYETRPSCEDFCLKLVKEDMHFSEGKILSEQIKNSKWFFLSWENDPTIASMLNMLDVIQRKFVKPDNILYQKLIGESSPIQFHFLPLEKFKLDDKIYVKMNSRGKPLTEFENFKANFSILLDIENKSKLDNEWLDIFWKLEKDRLQINIGEVDKKYLNFLKNVSLNLLAESVDIDKKIKDDFNIFDEYIVIYSQNNCLQDLSKVLDALASYSDDNKYFELFLHDDPDYWDRLRFYAVMRFFIKKGNVNSLNYVIFEKWIRVCTNLINNTRIEGGDAFYKAIRSIKRLSNNIDDLYEFLSNSNNKIEGFVQKQCEEEKTKAILLLDDKKWQSLIYSAETHYYFAGQIGFILEFSKNDENFDIELFKNYSEKLTLLFGNKFKENHDCLFQRSLLAFGDYLVPINYCKTFCSFNSNLREKTDNWRKVFDDKKKKYILKNFLDAIHQNSIEKDLKKIVDNYIENDWKRVFIKNKGIIEYCDKFRISSAQNKIALSRSPADNWRRHANLYSYALFLELKKEYKDVQYHDSSDDIPWIFINWKKKFYYIQEENSGYSYGYYKGNNDSAGLAEMQSFVEGVIAKTSLQKLESI
ncbi:MAG: DUF262 domain-containing protein [Flavobacterium sp.]|uniref:DUF262 domain-containing protein n=1 Tax=Flavobacterium sp. TaxID=239 RepID=UPI00326668FA